MITSSGPSGHLPLPGKALRADDIRPYMPCQAAGTEQNEKGGCLLMEGCAFVSAPGSIPGHGARGTIFFQVTQPRKRLTWTLQGLGRRRSCLSIKQRRRTGVPSGERPRQPGKTGISRTGSLNGESGGLKIRRRWFDSIPVHQGGLAHGPASSSSVFPHRGIGAGPGRVTESHPPGYMRAWRNGLRGGLISRRFQVRVLALAPF